MSVREFGEEEAMWAVLGGACAHAVPRIRLREYERSACQRHTLGPSKAPKEAGPGHVRCRWCIRALAKFAKNSGRAVPASAATTITWRRLDVDECAFA